MNALYSRIPVIALMCVFFISAAPAQAHALEVSGWIPYWATAKGTKTAISNITSFTEISPFAYSVKMNGTLADTAGIKKGGWKKLFAAARKNDVKIIPSVMWSDRDNISRILKDDALRAVHVEEVAHVVSDNDFDGIDIDYENKGASVRTFYSLFLKELKAKLGDKMLVCTIEARTPPGALYRVIPTDLEYANDYKEINKYCDRVRIMTYDQQTADWKLNEAADGPYAPLSDIAWVRKVMDLAAKDIDKDKLVMGIPTYGHEYEVTVSPTGGYTYRKLWAFNPGYVPEITKKYKVSATRADHGEMMVSYISKKSAAYKKKFVGAPSTTPKGELAIEHAISYAKASGKPTTVNILWWHDAGAIKQNLDLAASLGLQGVAFFKVDGSADKGMWKLI